MATNATEASRGYKVPAIDNTLSEDMLRLIDAITAIGVDVKALLTDVAGRALATHAHQISDITGLPAALDGKMAASKAFQLQDLTDTNGISGATDAQILKKVGTKWQPGKVDYSELSGTAPSAPDLSAYLTKAGNLAGLASIPAARATLQLGAMALVNPGLARTITSASTAAERNLTAADFGKLIIFSGTTNFTVTIDPAAGLGNGWSVDFKVNGRCVVTLDPNGSETINNATTLPVCFRQEARIVCTGSAFEAYGLQKEVVVDTANFTSVTNVDFLLPPGYEYFVLTGWVQTATGPQDIVLRTSTDGGSTFAAGAADYRDNYLAPASDGTYISGSANRSAGIVHAQATNTQIAGFTATIIAPRRSSDLTFYTSFSGPVRAGFATGPQIWSGQRNTAEDNNAIRVLPTAGNISGRFVLKGAQL